MIAVLRSFPRFSLSRIPLYWQVVIGIVAGITLAMLAPSFAREMHFFSDLFIKILKALLGPLIFCSLVTGVAGTEKPSAAGRVGITAMVYFTAMTSFALVLGMLVAEAVHPGSRMPHTDLKLLDTSSLTRYASAAEHADFTLSGQILKIIPDTFVSAFTGGELLQVLFLAVISSVALVKLGPQRAQPVMNLLRGGADMFFAIVKMLMALAPAAAFGAMAYTVGTFGAKSLGPLLGLVLLFYATGIVFVLVVLGTIARICGFRITDLLRYFKEELLLILGTASSEPAMPALMRKLEKLGVSRDTVSVVVPTGYSFNLDGTAIAMSLTLLFVGQALGIDLTFVQKVQLLLLCMLTSKGAAGVAGSGMVVMVSTLHTAGTIPVAGLTLVVGIDRFMSECRALVNFIGNAVATIAVAKYEKRLNVRMLRGELSGENAPEDGWG